MRIDSHSFYYAGFAGMSENQSGIARLNQQIASGKAYLAPKDDPLATEKILQLSNRVAVRSQFSANQDRAAVALKYELTVLTEMRDTLANARSLIATQSPSFDSSLRSAHAQNLAALARQVLSLANTRDPAGNYIFGGFDTNDAPFSNPLDGSATATTYDGTPITSTSDPAGTRDIEVDTGRFVQVNDNLNTVFQATEQTDAGVAVAGSVVSGSDLLQELDDAVANLPGATLTQADIDGWVAVIDTALSGLDGIMHRVSAAYTEVEDVRATTRSLLLQEKNALGDIEQVDQASAIMELQLRQTSLEAAQRAYSRTSGLSLFNFLG
ncbi:MAG: flagellar hook-associated protein FlgL [Pseudomonadota bacterium]